MRCLNSKKETYNHIRKVGDGRTQSHTRAPDRAGTLQRVAGGVGYRADLVVTVAVIPGPLRDPVVRPGLVGERVLKEPGQPLGRC